MCPNVYCLYNNIVCVLCVHCIYYLVCVLCGKGVWCKIMEGCLVQDYEGCLVQDNDGVSDEK